MSVKVQGLIWDWFAGKGNDMLLALALADECEHDGGGIFPSVPKLARRTRQSERTVQRQLRQMEASTWLQCVERSSGGRNRPNKYRINPAFVSDPDIFDFGLPNGDKLSPFEEGKPRHSCVTVSGSETVTETVTNPFLNGDTAVSPAIKPLKPIKPLSSKITGCAEPSDSANDIDVEDRRLAGWVFERILALHPKHKQPNWRRWCREIRLLQERDGRTRREIAELFAWANADPFWQTNILSPGKLREQWDQLVIRKSAECKTKEQEAPRPDYRCAFVDKGQRCEKAGKRSRGSHIAAPWYCHTHDEIIERREATA